MPPRPSHWGETLRNFWLLGIAFALAGCNGAIDGAAFVEGVDGLRCMAKVLAVADTGETINEDPIARLTLRVIPPSEAAAFNTTIEATVPRLSVPHRGDTLAVACDPAKPEQTQLIE